MNKFFFSLVLTLLPILSFTQIFDAELINQRTNIVINNNRLTKDLYFEIRINNRAGEKYTKITIPFSKLYKVSNIDAYIKDSSGKVVNKLKKSQIIERSSISDFSLYEDDFVKDFTLKHNSYPYTIVYSYQIQQKEFLYIDYWIPVLNSNIPTIDANLKISVPLNYSIKYANYSVNEPVIDTLANMVNYDWHTSYKDIIKHEVLSPTISSLLPAVSITPTEFYFDKKGSLKDWSSFGDWQFELIQGLSELPESEKNKILSLTENIKEEEEKIKALYHFLQDETRYINISIGTGGLKPYPASYVAQNKYGDCKALTNYFKSLLDYLGIKSYYTNVHAGTPIKKIDNNFPSQQFNHIVLYIPTNEKDIWLDCTSDGAFNYLGTFTQNRDAFIIDSNNSRFIKTPALLKDDVLETRKINVEYASTEALVTFKNSYRGDMYERISHVETNYNGSEKSRILRNFFVENGFELKNHQVSKSDRDSLKIDLTYNATSQQIYKHYGSDILISNITFSIPQFENPKERKQPLQIDYPIYKIDTLVYNIPEGYKLNQAFESFNESNKFGEYKFNIHENEGQIIVIKSLLINSGFYPISEYKDFYSFYENISGVENKKQLILNKQ